MRRWLPVLFIAFALVLLAGACDTDPEPDTGSGAEEDVDDPTSTTTPVAGYPLTGEPLEDEAALQRPVLAVKVDNHSRARPQHSLDRADVVMVEKVEGATRLIALFHSQQADTVGPVRSGRFVDAELLPSLRPAFAISGAAEPVLQELQQDLQLYGEGSAGAWERDASRPAPHNLFLATEPLFEAAAEDGLPPAEQPWPYDGDFDLAGGGEVTGADMSYPRAGTVSWEWDGEQFVRAQDGGPHELADGSQVAADNVLIVRVPPTSDVTHPFDPIGSGELVLLRDGHELTGTWEKSAPTEHFRWLGPEGQPLPLAPGTSWIELVPENGSVTVHAAGGADAGEDTDGES